MKKSIILSLIYFTCINAQTVELDEITVTAKSSKTKQEAPASMEIITKKELQEKGVASLEEALSDIVGLTPIGMSSGRSINGRESISIRGMDSKHTMLLIDGKRLTTMDKYITGGNFQYKLIPIAMIKKIEIIKGPISSLYGSSALGGVINIITKTPTEKFNGNVILGVGSPTHDRGGDGTNGSLSLSGAISKDIFFAYSGQYANIKPTKDKANDTLTEIEGEEHKNHFLSLWYNIDENNKIEFSTLQGDDKTKRTDYNSRTRAYDNKDYDIDKTHYNLGYKHYFDNGMLSVNAYENQTDIYINELKYTHELDDKVINAELKQKVFQNHSIVLGAEMNKEAYNKKYNDATQTGFDDKITNKSLYFQDEVAISTPLSITAGARYDDHANFGNYFSPKVYANYKINEKYTIKGGYGHGFNAPTLTENSDEYMSTIPAGQLRYIFHGNSQLKPEEADSFEISYIYKNQNSIFNTTIFYNDIKNLIEPIQTSKVSTTTNYTYQNIGNAKTKGLELSYNQKDLLDNLDINIFTTYMQTEDNNGNDLAFRPTYQGGIGINYLLPYQLNTRIDYHYIGSQYNTDITPLKLDSYNTLDMQLSKTFDSGIIARVGAKNITDERLDIDYRHQLVGRYIYSSLEYSF